MELLQIPELTEAEKKLPVSKYYYLPLYSLDPLHKQLLDQGPIDPACAFEPENWTELLGLPGEYPDKPFGYCRLPSGGGYISQYNRYPHCTGKMTGWYFKWINTPCRNQPEDSGNIKYKLYCQSDHMLHGYVNGKDEKEGIFCKESFDLNMGRQSDYGRALYSVSYGLDMREYGLSEEREKELKSNGVFFDLHLTQYCKEDGDHEPIKGSSIQLNVTRPCLTGGIEKLAVEWVGYGAGEGKFFFIPETPPYRLTEEGMRMVLEHATIECQHLDSFLPQLFAEYSVLSNDAD